MKNGTWIILSLGIVSLFIFARPARVVAGHMSEKTIHMEQGYVLDVDQHVQSLPARDLGFWDKVYSVTRKIVPDPSYLASSLTLRHQILGGYTKEIRWWALGVIAGFLLVFILSFLLLKRFLLRSLEDLTIQLGCLATLGGSRSRIPVKGNNQVARLGSRINELLLSFDETRNRESQTRLHFETLVNNLSGVVYRSAVDEKWGKEYLTRSFLDLTGYDPQEFMRTRGDRMKSLIDLIHPDDVDRVRECIARSGEKKWPFELRYRILHRDRSVRWVLDRGKLIFDPFSSRHWIDGVLLDITEQVEVERSLLTSETRYRDVFENSPIGLLIEDFSGVKKELDRLNGSGVHDLKAYFLKYPMEMDKVVPLFKIVDVNQKIVELFGVREKADLFKGIKTFTGEKSVALILLDLLAIFKGDRSSQAEGIYYRLDGSPFHVNVSWEVPSGVIGYDRVLLSVQDITARKNLEKRLRYSNHHDPLTDIHNRAYLEHQMAVLDLAQVGPVGAISIDVDGLKIVNDCLGHSEGDNLLRKTGSVLRRAFRESDSVARVGGDEFSIILPQCDFHGLQIALQRLDQEIQQENLGNSSSIPLSLSVGWAFRAKGTPSVPNLFIEADKRMYSCKISNRERVLRGFREKIEKSIDEMDRQNGGEEACLSNMIQALSRSMGLPDETRDRLLLLARYHRMGVLPLTVSDFKDRSEDGVLPEIEAGVRLALRWPDLVPIAPLLDSLAERWDGQGVPAKLCGEDIPLESRIFVPLLALLEGFCAHKGVGSAIASAFKKIEARSGTSYDPRVVEETIKARQFLSPFICINPSVAFEGSSSGVDQ